MGILDWVFGSHDDDEDEYEEDENRYSRGKGPHAARENNPDGSYKKWVSKDDVKKKLNKKK